MTSPITPLLTAEGSALLDQWYNLPERATLSSLEQSARLHQLGASPELSSAILTQCDLRDRAQRKFGALAQQMLFTRDGYEQATRHIVAARHAQRFTGTGATHVADLGCGNGADATAFAAAGLSVTAVDIDEDAAACTEWNLRVAAQAASPSPGFSVRVADVTALDVSGLRATGVDAIFADPARRTGRTRGASRVLSPDLWSPPLPSVVAWADSYERVGVKVAPGIDYEAIPADFFAEWTSVNGDLVEAALYSPALSSEGPGRQATVIHEGRVHTLLSPGSPQLPAAEAQVRPLGAFLAEPDSAVIRSGQVARLTEELDMGIVSPSIAYLTGDQRCTSPFLQVFAVLDVVALKPKMIASALRSLNAHAVEVKKRGADIVPEVLRQSLKKALQPKNADSAELTVFATRISGRHQAVIARRCL